MRFIIRNFKKKYLLMPQTVKASLLFTVCGILQKAISFVVVPIYTRIMPTESYGQYSVFLSWYQVIMVFTTLNMWNYLINNGMVKYKEDRKNFIASLQGLSTLITLCWFILYLPLSELWESWTNLSFAMMIMMFVVLLFMPSFEYFCAVKRFDYDAKGVVALTLAITFFTPFISIPLILCSRDKGLGAIGGKVIVSTICYASVYFYMLKGYKKLYNKEYWIFALKFNLPLIPHFLSNMILQQSDRIMIAKICGESDAAIYSVAYQAACALEIFNAAILNTFIPYTYKSIQNGNTDRVRKNSLILLLAIGAINTFAILFAPEIVTVLAPAEYRAAIYIIPPVAMSNLYMFLFNLFANVEYFWGKTKYVAMASFISAVINVVLNYVFVRKYGFIAAGYTTLICYILFSICHYFFMHKVENEFMQGKQLYDIRKIVITVGLFTVTAGFINIIYDLVIIRYSLLFIIALLFAINKKKIIRLYKSIAEKS